MVTDFEMPDAQLEPPTTAEIEALELFRRSPHPYHRRRSDKTSPLPSAGSSSTHLSHAVFNPSDRILSDEDGRKRRKTSQSPSESGTEADDEGYSFVKALPAPPIRPHKGLRDLRGAGINGGVSPLLTPSQIDEEGRRLSAEYFKVGRNWGRGIDAPLLTDEEARKARQKYLKRRRNEIIRRTTETALLGVIGVLAVKGCCCWGRLSEWHRELGTHAMVMCGALALYPLRLLNYSRKRDTLKSRRLRQRVRIPATFDPAPILYPAILPVLISISLFSSTQKILLPNILLGLAALPSQLIPYGGSQWGCSPIHWLVSILPLIASENTELLSKLSPPTPYKLKLPPPEEGLHTEILVSLFALHQALLPPLHYLTTTSLLPAELHLLSISLINLYLFADSPQANIPKALLWFGGVGLFVLCGKVLKWGVALARIPRWRFRRAGQLIKNRQSFLQILNQSLKPKRSHSAGGGISDSDADEDNFLIKNPLKGAKLKLDILKSLKHNSILGNGNGNGNENGTQSAVEPKPPITFAKRRNTLPCLPSPTHATRRRSKSVAQSFLSLTPTQAAVRKWIYACYFYLVVVVMILGPIRYLIGKNALHDHEPFGWAIGYLFGNIQRLRFEVQNWDLEYWIPLPPLLDSTLPSSVGLGIAEYLRTVVLGEANTRLLLCAYCLSIIALGLTTVLSLTIIEVDTRRKVFHGMMVAMLAPTIFIDPCFIALALSLILAIFLLLDLIRASQLPPLSRPLASFLTPYVDGRDLRGPVVVSHIFLLIGCAIPLWLSLAGTERTGLEPWIGWDVAARDVSMISGVVCVGMGDAAASLIGRRYGRRKWPWAGGKSLEGSAAFAVAVTVGLVAGKIWLKLGGWDDTNAGSGGLVYWGSVVARTVVCAMGASLNEAVLTGGNDNVVVPVVLWVLVRGVRL